MNSTFLCEEEKLDVLYFIDNGSREAKYFINAFKRAVGITGKKDIVMSLANKETDTLVLYICTRKSGGRSPITLPFNKDLFSREEGITEKESLFDYLDEEFVETFRDQLFLEKLKTEQKDVYMHSVKGHLNTVNSFLFDLKNKGYEIVEEDRENRKITLKNRNRQINISYYERESEVYYKNGKPYQGYKPAKIDYVIYYKNGEKHREDGPAKIDYYKNGNIKEEEYWQNGNLHREDGPAIIDYYENGKIKDEKYFINNGLHREDGPAVIGYYENGNIKNEEYSINDNIHREDGPAVIGYYENGNIKNEEYYLNNERHREDGPAYIDYYENGNINNEEYYINGEIHREDRPAFIGYDENGNIQEVRYYENGRLIYGPQN